MQPCLGKDDLLASLGIILILLAGMSSGIGGQSRGHKNNDLHKMIVVYRPYFDPAAVVTIAQTTSFSASSVYELCYYQGYPGFTAPLGK